MINFLNYMRVYRVLNYFLVLAIVVVSWPFSANAQTAEPVLISAPITVATYLQDEDIEVAGVTLRIMAGSVQDGLEIDEDSITVSIPEGEAFEIRSTDYHSRVMENDALQPTCNVLRNHNNQMFVQGPRVIDIRPSAYVCSPTGYDTDNTPFVILSTPTEGQELAVGQSVQLFWQTEGTGANAVRIRLSTDNGVNFSEELVNGLMNNGFYQWVVPEVYTTDQAVLKIEGMDGAGNIKSVGVSPIFRIEGEESPPPPIPPTWDFDVEAAKATSPTGNIGDIFLDGSDLVESGCATGLRVKLKTSSAVYLCGSDGRRHAFPNARIYDSWYLGDYAGVVEVGEETLASLPLGANVTYRAGMRMVKITTDPKTYVVDSGNVLRWVPSEDAAVALYGESWNQMIDDLPDAFFTDYTIGEPIEFK